MKARLWLPLVAALVLALAGLGVAFADGPEVMVEPPSVEAGGTATIEGHEFAPNSEVTISAEGLHEPLAVVETDGDGHFQAAVTIPHEMAEGHNELMVTDAEGVSGHLELEVVAMGAAAATAEISDARFSEQIIERIPSTYEAAEVFVEGTIAAALPMLWLLIVALHLARPYMLNVVQKFSLRLGADLWWLVYLAARDLLTVITFLMSTIFLLPHVLEMADLPITGSVTAAIVFAVLVVKLVRDADEDPRALLLVSYLLAAGAAIYLVSFALGVMGQDLASGGAFREISDRLVTRTNLETAKYMSYGSLAAIVGMGLYALAYNLRIAFRRTPEAEAEAGN